tara:strand:+ start:216 stop:443 length:228 start_codon:yes stop_codon:yes gene_type:complete
MPTDIDRRKDSGFNEQQAYKSFNLNQQIKQERRSDNLEKLIEVQQQKKVYYITVGFCITLNIILLSLGFIGLGGN